MDNTQQPQSQNKINKNQIIYTAVAVVVIILLVIFLRPDSANGPADVNAPATNEADSSDIMKDKGNGTSDRTGGTVNASDEYSGILQESDNSAIGNLMLVQPERNIYLFSSRDFSALYGKKVKLVTEGELEQFRLLDIVVVE